MVTAVTAHAAMPLHYALEEEHPEQSATCVTKEDTHSGIADASAAQNATNAVRDTPNRTAPTRKSTTMFRITTTLPTSLISETTETGTCLENAEEENLEENTEIFRTLKRR
jgi:hypothetical protein